MSILKLANKFEVLLKNANGKPFGIEAKLTEGSREKLISWFEKTVGELHPQVVCNHMTVVNVPILRREDKKANLNPEDYPVGEKVKLKVIAYAADDKCQAVAVDPIGIVAKNKIPHITVALNGAPAKYSNELLANTYNPCIGPDLDAEIVISYS